MTIEMADATHSESSPATYLQLSNIARDLQQLQTNTKSPATERVLSNIATQIEQLQTHYFEQEEDHKKQISALEAKVNFQASEVSSFTSMLETVCTQMEDIKIVQGPPPSELILKQSYSNIANFQRLLDAIRQRIWRYTFPESRIVQLFGTERVLGLAGKLPVAMHICRDSRQAARSV